MCSSDLVSYYVGEMFDDLVHNKIVVGLDDDPVLVDSLEYNHHLEMELSESTDHDGLFDDAKGPIEHLSKQRDAA